MNVYTAVAINHIAIISLVGLGIYITRDWWPLLALFFLAHTHGEDIKKEKI